LIPLFPVFDGFIMVFFSQPCITLTCEARVT
jgi:hypothetical protein